MDRAAIAAILRETAELLELDGENPFRCRAYANGSKAIAGLAEDPLELLELGRLAEVRGIGPGLAAGIAELLVTGRLAIHEELRSRRPPGVLELLRVPGLGPKRLRLLIDALDIGTPSELAAACRDGRVASLSGFGAKSAEKLLASIERLEREGGWHLLPDSLRVARSVAATLAEHPAIGRVEITGDLRRSCETISRIELLAEVSGGVELELVANGLAERRDLAGALEVQGGQITMELAGGYRVETRLTPSPSFAAALAVSTGSRAHLDQLRSRAERRGFLLADEGLFADGRPVAGSETEEGIYRALGLAWIPPEAREGWDEIELAATGSFPRLVEPGDIRGALHVHSDWSDGLASMEELATRAGELGWEYLGIADHSRSATYARGLTPERVEAQWRAIDAWNSGGRSPRLLKGSEVDVLADGSLDFPDELLLGFDFVVASVHSRFGLAAEAQTERLVRALSHPCVTILGHPTGRLLLLREPYAVDLEAVLEAAAEHGVVVELNSNPRRFDLDWRELRRELARGRPTALDPDAHSLHGLSDVELGVGIARKALGVPERILNCWSLERLEAHLERRRERARALLGASRRDPPTP